MLSVTYLHHSGFFVETDRHILLFDYFRDHAPEDGTLGDGVFHPEEYAGKRLALFVSHHHADHFDPVIFEWAKNRPDTLYFVGKDVRRVPGNIQHVFRMRSGDVKAEGGVEVTALRSTDDGVAFIVQVDGVLLYHAGDLNDWRWEGEPEADNAHMTAAYLKEMEKLKEMRFDAAFVPVDPRQGADMKEGLRGFLAAAEAAHIFPMHFWGDFSVCSAVAEDSALQRNGMIIHQIAGKGEQFKL
ncbi:MAG: MBL fold metallo-hydrolase [Oscillospiraceae bacterium]|nr:MBL fold metallo-hydrolase [Oscillospiraceae bacterium]MDY3064894.1 MBL fold metallo-hydrolase [Oscillospiraceae bacterium]